ncbi:MAG: hypothetical protein ABIS45_07255 [Burkholderiales bacterium]
MDIFMDDPFVNQGGRVMWQPISVQYKANFAARVGRAPWAEAIIADALLAFLKSSDC